MNTVLKIILAFTMVFTLSGIVYSHGAETFAIAEGIIESKIPCEDISDDQLEIIGDYYMEQMHPGEAHEVMDAMMGGEGSESLREMHINMGKAFYCGEHEAMSSGMMNTMMGRGMMGAGMMSSGFLNTGGGNMMNTIWPFGFMGGFGWLFMVLFWIAVIWLIVWLMKQYAQPKKGFRRESAMDVLKKRFAKGEITKKQYESMKKELSK